MIHPRGFNYWIFILMVKRIPLLALISSRTAVGSLSEFGLGPTSWVGLGRKGRHAAAVSLCLSLRGSIGLGRRRWGCYPGSEGGVGSTYFSSVNPLAFGGHLTNWDRKHEGPILIIDNTSV